MLNPIVDTLGLARGLFGTGDNNLRALAARLKLPAETWHRALGDTRTTEINPTASTRVNATR